MPSCVFRSTLVQAIRRFFDERGFYANRFAAFLRRVRAKAPPTFLKRNISIKKLI